MEKKIKTVVIDSDTISRELIISYLKNVTGIDVTEEFDNPEQAFVSISKNFPDLIVIDISKQTDVSLDIITKISKNLKNTKIIVLSYSTDPDILIKALRAGAREFLVKPLIEKNFTNIVERLKNLILGNTKDTEKCKVITAFSNKGGVGKTSIAVNLAFELAKLTKEKIALIDLNTQMGDVATFLDLNSDFNLHYIMQSADKINESNIAKSLVKYKNTNLYVLADSPSLGGQNFISPENIAHLIDVLRDVFSYVVIDTANNFDDNTLAVLDNSDLILLIAMVNLPSIRNCQRCLDLFMRLNYPKEKIKIIVNRFIESGKFSVKDMESVLKKSVYFKLPNNYLTVNDAMDWGKPISEVNENSNIAKSFKELASLLADNFIYQTGNMLIKRDKTFSLSSFFKKGS